jgi:hypothetical protein
MPTVVLEPGSAQTLQGIIAERGLNLLLLGSYGRSVFREVFIGSTLDFTLRTLPAPIFICRQKRMPGRIKKDFRSLGPSAVHRGASRRLRKS